MSYGSHATNGFHSPCGSLTSYGFQTAVGSHVVILSFTRGMARTLMLGCTPNAARALHRRPTLAVRILVRRLL